MSGITIKEIQELAIDSNNIKVTVHLSKRLIERRIKFSDVKRVLFDGEIIEQYPTAFPYPACLLLGFCADGLPLHVCCGIGEGKLWIITSYIPDTNEWESDYKTRKAVK